MAKIPTEDIGPLPRVQVGSSGVENNRGQAALTSGIERIGDSLEGLSRVADAAAARKQAFLDDLSALKLSSDYGQNLQKSVTDTKAQFDQRPDLGYQQFRDTAEAALGQSQKDMVAQKWSSQAILSAYKQNAEKTTAAVDDMYRWQIGRSTQQAKNLVDQTLTDTARDFGDTADISGFSEGRAKAHELYDPKIDMLHEDGKDRKDKFDIAAANATVLGWIDHKQAGMALQELNKPDSPLFTTSSGVRVPEADIARWKKAARDGVVQTGKDGDADLLASNTDQANTLSRAVREGHTSWALFEANRDKLAAQMDAVKASPAYTPEQKQTQLAALDKQARIVDLQAEIYRKDPVSVADTKGLADKALLTWTKYVKGDGSPASNDLRVALDAHHTFVEARHAGAITAQEFNTFSTHLDEQTKQAVTTGWKTGEVADGWFHSAPGQAETVAGLAELEARIPLNPALDNRESRWKLYAGFVDEFNKAGKGGTPPSVDDARRFADQAIEKATGKYDQDLHAKR